MQYCSPTVAPVIKGDVFGSHQCPKTEVEHEEMKRIPYASVVGSLTYAQVCTRPDIAFICGMLGRFQSNPGLHHWKAAKKYCDIFKERRSTNLLTLDPKMLKLFDTRIQTLQNAKTLVGQLWDIFSCCQVDLFLGRVKNKC